MSRPATTGGLGDLTKQEQTNVRTALRFLRSRCGGWKPLAAALHMNPITLGKAIQGRTVTPNLAFRVARFAGVSFDDLLAGKYPAPGTCPYCGHVKEDGAAEGTPG